VPTTGGSGDRKDGTVTAHVGRYGKTDKTVAMTMLRADESMYHPLRAVPCAPARRFERGRNDPGYRTTWRIAAKPARQPPAAARRSRQVRWSA
jgi:hypothetical protein